MCHDLDESFNQTADKNINHEVFLSHFDAAILNWIRLVARYYNAIISM